MTKNKKTGAISRNKGVHGTDKQTAGPAAGPGKQHRHDPAGGQGRYRANLIKQADDALEARELIKGRVLDNNIDYDARTAAEELAKATRSEWCRSSARSSCCTGRATQAQGEASSW